jgi:hypothetical protein
MGIVAKAFILGMTYGEGRSPGGGAQNVAGRVPRGGFGLSPSELTGYAKNRVHPEDVSCISRVTVCIGSTPPKKRAERGPLPSGSAQTHGFGPFLRRFSPA